MFKLTIGAEIKWINFKKAAVILRNRFYILIGLKEAPKDYNIWDAVFHPGLSELAENRGLGYHEIELLHGTLKATHPQFNNKSNLEHAPSFEIQEYMNSDNITARFLFGMEPERVQSSTHTITLRQIGFTDNRSVFRAYFGYSFYSDTLYCKDLKRTFY